MDSNVDVSYISRLESGIENPTVGLLEKLAAALNEDVSAFLLIPPKGDKKPAPLKSGRRPK
ncbi:helix-turn-helix domain-containing protein [Pseudolabrys taiwanensis]|uniref:helix-turn-helix domain-containing protein n=1 Tax=Pseudolabrys taiwanensis TaxID=331696 RepID=UPI001FE119AD|nr:helix-turn-helix transcriptional regulator [Pseudolabrys taiwanensis]